MGGGVSPVQQTAVLRHLWSLPRQTLVFESGGDTLYQVVGPDLAGGPTPKEVTVTAIAGTETFHIDFTVEFHLNECPAFAGSEVRCRGCGRETAIVTRRATPAARS